MSRSRERSDQELVDAFIEGDNKAFSAIVERHRHRLSTVARRYTRNDDDAQDVVQEALLRASSSIHTYRRESAFSTWLHRLVMNSGYDYLNHRANKENLSFEDLEISPDANPILGHNPSNYMATKVTVLDALRKLRADQRAAIYLTDVIGYPLRDVAEAHGVQPGTIKSRRARARKKLREAIY